MLGSIDTLQRVLTPGEIVERIPAGSYPEFCQPGYPDPTALEQSLATMQEMKHVVEPEHVLALRKRLAAIAQGEPTPLILAGRCSEPNRRGMVTELAREGRVMLRVIAAAGLSRAVKVLRGCGQFIKPRSNEIEEQEDGSLVASFMGEGINGRESHDRAPDPQRLVRGMAQSRELRKALIIEDPHVAVAHEALSLPYEMAQMYIDPVTGKKVILSGELLWIGERTNGTEQPLNPHIDLLADVENPIGVKIGPKSDEAHIAELSRRLNPNREPGKLIFMIRVGDNITAMRRVLHGIKHSAPEAIVQFDIHGSRDRAENGMKRGSVEKTVHDVRLLADECDAVGLRLHGVHLETTGDHTRYECVEKTDQLPDPTMRPDVDPLFNPSQFQSILEQIKDYLPGGGRYDKQVVAGRN